MLKLMTKYIIQYGINYSNTLSSFEKKSTIIAGEKVKNLRLALIKRKGKEIDYRSWTPTQKGYIASEYPHEVFKFLTAKGISSDCYGLIRINGQSESYLVL